MAGKLKIVVLYDRWEPDEDESAGNGKSPVVRTLDKKEVEEEVAEALTKLGHEPALHELDGTAEEPARAGAARLRSRLQPERVVCRRRHRRLQDRGYPRADRQEIHRLRQPRPDAGAGQGVAKKIFAFHGIHTPDLRAGRSAAASISPHDLQFPVIVKPAREDGSIGIEFSAVVSLHPGADGADGLAARATSIPRCSSRNTSTAARCTSASSATTSPRRCRSSSSICRSCPKARRGLPRRK